jgi:glycosyltransferase involved in cell wall biosynthesis
MPEPAVSVVIPCFNYGHLLQETLDSVRCQSLADWECIVVDDGSTDDTGAIARACAAEDPRFRYVRHENRGLSAARNTGLRNSRGALVQLLDADDLLEPDKLNVHSRYLAQHGEYSLVYGAMRYFTDKGSVRTLSRAQWGSGRDWMRLWPDSTQDMLVALIRGNIFPVSAALFRRSVLDEAGHFDESLRSHEDWEFWLRFAFAGKRFHGLDAPGTRTLIREHSESLTRRSITMAETRLEVRRRIEKLAPTEALREVNREWISYDECELGAALLAAGKWRVGVRSFFSGFSHAERKTKAIHPLLAHLTPRWVLAFWRRLRWGAPARESG